MESTFKDMTRKNKMIFIVEFYLNVTRKTIYKMFVSIKLCADFFQLFLIDIVAFIY